MKVGVPSAVIFGSPFVPPGFKPPVVLPGFKPPIFPPTAAGRFTFNSHEPGEHVICINTNSTRWFGGNVLVCIHSASSSLLLCPPPPHCNNPPPSSPSASTWT